MRRLSSIIIILLSLAATAQKSPHGEEFRLACQDCHNPASWKIDFKTLTFNHGETRFPLLGQHQAVSCRQCHQSLNFSKAGKECMDCHTDIHNQTVGPDCARCHSPVNWMVPNITDIHRKSRFPLTGAHQTADCFDCHTNASTNCLLFGPLGIECIDCHQPDYASAKNPDHQLAGFSTLCTDCHTPNALTWIGAGFDHNRIYPLTGAHAVIASQCGSCHQGNYQNTPNTCVGCHLENYNRTTNPPHSAAQFPVACDQCHNTSSWQPASWDHDNQYFPIYSGKHRGEWNSCTDCHTNPGNYAIFSCIDCHEHNRADMDDEHEDVSGYSYNSIACYDCHRNGSASAPAFKLRNND